MMSKIRILSLVLHDWARPGGGCGTSSGESAAADVRHAAVVHARLPRLLQGVAPQDRGVVEAQLGSRWRSSDDVLRWAAPTCGTLDLQRVQRGFRLRVVKLREVELGVEHHRPSDLAVRAREAEEHDSRSKSHATVRFWSTAISKVV